MRRSASSSRPIWCGSRPAALSASAIVVPSASVRLRARRAVIAPVMTREPAQATPKRAPSSSTKLTTPMGRDGWKPLSRNESTAARALTTPSGPSNAPPSGTLSRCEPVTTPLSPCAARRVWVSPPGPLVAHPVLGEVEAARRALPGEPLAQVVVLTGPRVATVATALGAASDRLQVGPHRLEAHGVLSSSAHTDGEAHATLCSTGTETIPHQGGPTHGRTSVNASRIPDPADRPDPGRGAGSGKVWGVSRRTSPPCRSWRSPGRRCWSRVSRSGWRWCRPRGRCSAAARGCCSCRACTSGTSRPCCR